MAATGPSAEGTAKGAECAEKTEEMMNDDVKTARPPVFSDFIIHHFLLFSSVASFAAQSAQEG